MVAEAVRPQDILDTQSFINLRLLCMEHPCLLIIVILLDGGLDLLGQIDQYQWVMDGLEVK